MLKTQSVALMRGPKCVKFHSLLAQPKCLLYWAILIEIGSGPCRSRHPTLLNLSCRIRWLSKDWNLPTLIISIKSWFLSVSRIISGESILESEMIISKVFKTWAIPASESSLSNRFGFLKGSGSVWFDLQENLSVHPSDSEVWCECGSDVMER